MLSQCLYLYAYSDFTRRLTIFWIFQTMVIPSRTVDMALSKVPSIMEYAAVWASASAKPSIPIEVLYGTQRFSFHKIFSPPSQKMCCECPRKSLAGFEAASSTSTWRRGTSVVSSANSSTTRTRSRHSRFI